MDCRAPTILLAARQHPLNVVYLGMFRASTKHRLSRTRAPSTEIHTKKPGASYRCKPKVDVNRTGIADPQNMKSSWRLAMKVFWMVNVLPPPKSMTTSAPTCDHCDMSSAKELIPVTPVG